jgi:hypothetical protein
MSSCWLNRRTTVLRAIPRSCASIAAKDLRGIPGPEDLRPEDLRSRGIGLASRRGKPEAIAAQADVTLVKGSLAERVGFEPTVPVKVQRFSRPSRSTTLAPLLSEWRRLIFSPGTGCNCHGAWQTN